MIQLLLHVLGDYLFQNDWIAKNKSLPTKEGYLACVVHVSIYGLAFSVIAPSISSLLIIVLSHFIIDKWRLAKFWFKLVNWNWKSDYGFNDDKPFAIAIWLLFIADNWFHVFINYLAIKFL